MSNGSSNTDRLTDSLDRAWAPSTLLGRGAWGRSRVVRDSAGREAVLKEPLTEADFPADAPLPDDLLSTCRTAARQQSDLLQFAAQPYLPRLEATIDLGNGRLGLVLPKYVSLQRRLEAGMPLGEVLRLVHRIAVTLADANAVHGNLRPSNVLFGERGEPFLADSATPALAQHHLRLIEHAGGRHWLPPEARNRPAARWDTWALCQIVHAAILVQPSGEDRPAVLPLASGGLDKVALATLKDTAHAKLAAEETNPRFRARVTERIGALLSRGLSHDVEPSPPYRFTTARDLAERVNEILALLRPRVTEVGRIMLPASAADGVFQASGASGSEVSFSVTVGCTIGVSSTPGGAAPGGRGPSQGAADHEDLVCGLQLVDLDAEHDRRPVEDAGVVVQVHPSGRLRFQLTLPRVMPGRYRVRVAFAIKDSGDEPLVATGDFEVRPPPGYVPPRAAEPTEPAAIPFAGRRRSEPATSAGPGTSAGADDDRAVERAGASGPTLMMATSPGNTSASERGSSAGSSAGSSRGSSPGHTRATPGADSGRRAGRGTDPHPSEPNDGELVVGAFPRPVAPPDDDEPDRQDRRAVASPPAPDPRHASARPSRLPTFEPVTDATMPAPNAWPPTFSPNQGAYPTATPHTAEPRAGRNPLAGVDEAPERNEPMDTEEDPASDGRAPLAERSARGAPAADPHAHRTTPSSLERALDRRAADVPSHHDPRVPGVVGGGHLTTPVEPTPYSPPRVGSPPPATLRPGLAAASSRPHAPSRPAEPAHRPGSRPAEVDLPDLPVAELPDFTGGTDARVRRGPSLASRMVDAVRRDTYVAVGTAVAICLVLVLATSALLKACG